MLTAAHCIDYANPPRVFAGGHNRYDQNETTIQIRNITWLLKHEGYDLSVSVDHDVGLIMVDPPFEFIGTGKDILLEFLITL